MSDTTGTTDGEWSAWRTLSLMHAQLVAAVGRSLAAVELSYTDFQVLEALGRAQGRARVVELGDELGWEKSRVSHHVTRMQERGLVAKERCPTDHRGLYVVLTSEGRRVVRRAAPVYALVIQRNFVDRVTPAQLRGIRDAADAVLDGLTASDSGGYTLR